jgi:hypothetical protein
MLQSKALAAEVLAEDMRWRWGLRTVIIDDGSVPTVTGVCDRRPSCTRGGLALARTGSPQRTVWRRVL